MSETIQRKGGKKQKKTSKNKRKPIVKVVQFPSNHTYKNPITGFEGTLKEHAENLGVSVNRMTGRIREAYKKALANGELEGDKWLEDPKLWVPNQVLGGNPKACNRFGSDVVFQSSMTFNIPTWERMHKLNVVGTKENPGLFPSYVAFVKECANCFVLNESHRKAKIAMVIKRGKRGRVKEEETLAIPERSESEKRLKLIKFNESQKQKLEDLMTVGRVYQERQRASRNLYFGEAVHVMVNDYLDQLEKGIKPKPIFLDSENYVSELDKLIKLAEAKTKRSPSNQESKQQEPELITPDDMRKKKAFVKLMAEKLAAKRRL